MLPAGATPGVASPNATPRVAEAIPGTPHARERRAATRATLAGSMSEALLDRQIRAIATSLGLLSYHTHNSQRSPAGFPDLVLVGQKVIFRELKTQTGRVSPAQAQWIAALTAAGQDAGLWRPADLLSGQIARELAAAAGLRRIGTCHD
jgi:VRR-NUC domain